MRSVILPKAELSAGDANSVAAASARAMPDVNHLLRGLDGRVLPFNRLKMMVSPVGLGRIPSSRQPCFVHGHEETGREVASRKLIHEVDVE